MRFPRAAPLNLLRLLPRVSPLGILEPGDNDAASPRVYPKALRIAALVLLGIFLVVVVVTTSLSLGSYCLTTDAGSTRPALNSAPALPGSESPGGRRTK